MGLVVGTRRALAVALMLRGGLMMALVLRGALMMALVLRGTLMMQIMLRGTLMMSLVAGALGIRLVLLPGTLLVLQLNCANATATVQEGDLAKEAKAR